MIPHEGVSVPLRRGRETELSLPCEDTAGEKVAA